MLTDSSLKYYRDSTAEEVRQSGKAPPPPSGAGRGRGGVPRKGLGGPRWGEWNAWTVLALPLQADELDGEIDLRSCTDVTEYAVQRNYGFQIHVRPRAVGVA